MRVTTRVTSATRSGDALFAGDAIMAHTPFKASGLSAVVGAPYGHGRLYLHPETLAQWKQDRDAVVYTVLSYGTPIAWVLADGAAVVPDVRYSATTARHQSAARYLTRS